MEQHFTRGNKQLRLHQMPYRQPPASIGFLHMCILKNLCVAFGDQPSHVSNYYLDWFGLVLYRLRNNIEFNEALIETSSN